MTQPGQAGFLVERPTGMRKPGFGHPLRHVILQLDRTIRDLGRGLQLRPGMRLLDYGCGDGYYRTLAPPGVDYVGADLAGNANASAELNADGTLPFPDAEFDAVLSTQVLEHVAEPHRYLAECHRVLRPGGRMLLSTHGIMVHHRDPVDYWRWTHEGLRTVVAAAGFEIVEFRGVVGLAATALQLFLFATYVHVPGWLRPCFAAVMQQLVAFFDWMHSDESRAREALVFALVARKPADGRSAGP